MYLVKADPPLSRNPKWIYCYGYFPKEIQTKKEAHDFARQVKENGGRAVRVEKVK
jgi:hypothetical protein